MEANRLVIKVGGKSDLIDIDSFLRVVRETVSILSGLERNIADSGKSSLRWQIEHIKMESPLEMTIVGSSPMPTATSIAVVNSFLSGLRSIEEHETRPAHFTDELLKRSKKLVEALDDDGVTDIEFSAPHAESIRVTQHLAANVDVVIGKPHAEYSMDAQFEGRLEQISIHGEAPVFCIYDALSDRPIKCSFSDKHIERVADYLKRRARVRVWGETKFNNKHHPVSLVVKDVSELREQTKLPQIKDLHAAGIDLVRRRDSVEIVRELRDRR